LLRNNKGAFQASCGDEKILAKKETYIKNKRNILQKRKIICAIDSVFDEFRIRIYYNYIKDKAKTKRKRRYET